MKPKKTAMTNHETINSPTHETTDRPSLAEGLNRTLTERNKARAAAVQAERQAALAVYSRALTLEVGLEADPVSVAELENAMKVLGFAPGAFAVDVGDCRQFIEWSSDECNHELQSRLARELAQRLSAEAEAKTAALRKAEADLEEVRGRTFRETAEANSNAAALGQVVHKRRRLAERLAILGVDTAALAASVQGAA